LDFSWPKQSSAGSAAPAPTAPAADEKKKEANGDDFDLFGISTKQFYSKLGCFRR
jgi:hypothetical protein